MKKVILAMFLVLSCSTIFTSCSSNDDEDFAYPMETLCGKWNAKQIKVAGKWYDVTEYPYTKYAMSITFNDDGTFTGSGYLGNGGGTYKANGKTITTYINGEEYITYTVSSLSSDVAYLSLTMGGSTIEMKAEKQYTSYGNKKIKNPFVGMKFYKKNSDGYTVIEFVDDFLFKYTKTDEKLNPNSTYDFTGNYTYNAETNEIDFNKTFVYERIGLTFENKKLMSGKYYDNYITVNYIYNYNGGEWSTTELTMEFYNSI